MTHGTLKGYTVHGCRDECCASAHRAYMNRYRTRRHIAGGATMVPARLIHAHIARLKDAGWSEWDIVRAAGWRSRNNLADVLTRRNVQQRTAQRILSIDPDSAVRRTQDRYVRADFTADRLLELKGDRSWRQVAAQLGMNDDALRDIANGEKVRIRRSTALRVLAVYADHLRGAA